MKGFQTTYKVSRLSRAENDPLSRKVSLFEDRSLQNKTTKKL